MAEAIVPSLIKLIPDVLKLSKEEWKLGSDAKTELEYLEDLIGAIGRFLKKAALKEVIDEDLKASMKRARKFIYDAQDALDDFIQRDNRKWEGLGLYIHKHYNRRTFSSEAKRIRQMVENYKTTLETSNALSADHAKSSSACHRSLSISFSNERDNELFGIETAREQLVGWLTADSQTQKVIFVHGVQGGGKTSLVGTVLRNEKVKRHFRFYVWIKDLRSYELVDDKAAALMKANAQIWDLTKEDSLGFQRELGEVFKSLLCGNFPWVLILDDAGSAHVFEHLQSLLERARPSVLVTTRDSSLQSNSRTFLNLQMAQSDGAPLEPTKLLYDIRHFKHPSRSSEKFSTLLCRKTFQMDSYPNVLKNAFESIVKQCGGLPLAILAASNLLSDIQGGVNGTPQGVKWKKLSGRLGEALLSKGDKSGPIRRMITLRMDHLHDVRACLFYLSIFPLNHCIRCSTLMRLWMAERFIEQKGTNPVQTIAEETLKRLVDHNLFQMVEETSYERAKTCCIYNILHQIIISKSKDDEFAMIVDDLEEEWPETLWRLSIHSKMDTIKDDTRVKRLRSLLIFAEVHPGCMEELLKQVSRLKVLDIQDCSLEEFPRGLFKLRYLRYLRLKGSEENKSTKVIEIPEDIETLEHLETLDLKGLKVPKLPKNIVKLKALRHLLVYRSNRSPDLDSHPKYGVKAPSGLEVGLLTSLQKLCLIDLNPVEVRSKESNLNHGKILLRKLGKWRSTELNIKHGKILLGELGKLKNLRRLGISNLRRGHVENLCSSIGNLGKLEALHLIAAEGYDGIVDLPKVDGSKAFPFLQRVHLTGRMTTFPNWILTPSLAKLFMRKSQLKKDDFQHFKVLQCLKHLDLQDVFCDLTEMVFKEGDFEQLCFLGLDTFHSLESITVQGKALPALKKLSLSRCSKFKTLPQGVQVKCLKFHEMPDEFKEALEQNKELHVHEMEWLKPAVMPGDFQESPRPPVENRK